MTNAEKDAVRLIDADALIAQLKTLVGCAECDNYNGVRCRACNWDDVISYVDDFADNHPIAVE